MTLSVSLSWRATLSAYAPLLFWVGVIFYLSGSDASFAQTSRIIGPLLRLLFPDADPDTLAVYHGYIRKLAHIVVYAVLGITAVRAFRWQFGTSTALTWAPASLLLVLVVASLDEINQSFLSVRTGTLTDVLLDTVSGAAVIGILLFWHRRQRNKSKSAN